MVKQRKPLYTGVHKPIERKQIRVTNQNGGKHSQLYEENKGTHEHFSATKTNTNTHINELFDNNCHIPDLVQNISRKNGELNLIEWLTKHPTF